jgi:hypothetical protein
MAAPRPVEAGRPLGAWVARRTAIVLGQRRGACPESRCDSVRLAARVARRDIAAGRYLWAAHFLFARVRPVEFASAEPLHLMERQRSAAARRALQAGREPMPDMEVRGAGAQPFGRPPTALRTGALKLESQGVQKLQKDLLADFALPVRKTPEQQGPADEVGLPAAGELRSEVLQLAMLQEAVLQPVLRVSRLPVGQLDSARVRRVPQAQPERPARVRLVWLPREAERR